VANPSSQPLQLRLPHLAIAQLCRWAWLVWITLFPVQIARGVPRCWGQTDARPQRTSCFSGKKTWNHLVKTARWFPCSIDPVFATWIIPSRFCVPCFKSNFIYTVQSIELFIQFCWGSVCLCHFSMYPLLKCGCPHHSRCPWFCTSRLRQKQRTTCRVLRSFLLNSQVYCSTSIHNAQTPRVAGSTPLFLGKLPKVYCFNFHHVAAIEITICLSLNLTQPPKVRTTRCAMTVLHLASACHRAFLRQPPPREEKTCTTVGQGRE
jgi:hypothetical protein